MIPIEDLTDVTLAIKDTDENDEDDEEDLTDVTLVTDVTLAIDEVLLITLHQVCRLRLRRKHSRVLSLSQYAIVVRR